MQHDHILAIHIACWNKLFADCLRGKATNTNIAVTEKGLKHGVRTYIFVPCIVCRYNPTGQKIQTKRDQNIEACRASFSSDRKDRY